jgi:hypothetical protein
MSILQTHPNMHNPNYLRALRALPPDTYFRPERTFRNTVSSGISGVISPAMS